ncbi:hypothetical protein B0A55_05514 [Friedmanniomyces simplex]|uniref:RBR-type E3 ubiquitin transferase n=1 Tax=Friedmanniomyces simplex TaxID=329884 RepID=A0A4U0XC78_9PEZI|nr:hypothetical protein B0A55_05514 [Friedmanniomyces simplex]
MAPRKPAVPAAPLVNPPARRSARLNPPQESAPKNAKNSTKSRIAKTKKTPKPMPLKFDCTICGRALAASSLPDHLAPDHCEHLINTCKQCVKAWIAAQLDSTTYDRVSCPECPEIMTKADVKQMAAKDVYARYEEMERRGVAERIPGWRWCLNSKCRAGQVYEPLLKAAAVAAREGGDFGVAEDRETGAKARRASKRGKAKKPTVDLPHDDDDDDDIFTCNECGEKACVPCDRPYHDGETCAEYRERRTYDDKTSEEFIEKKYKRCPNKAGCNANIEKDGGCDFVFCTRCKTQFCWRCLADYRDINKGLGHNKGCVYAAPGAIDPHAMHVQPPLPAAVAAPAQAHGGAGGAGGGILQNVAAMVAAFR